jgi:hypothetical protein
VALSCFIRALLRGLMEKNTHPPPHNLLVEDYHKIVKDGLDAKTQNSNGQTGRQICGRFMRVAWENATREEKKYLPVIQKRVEYGSLSEVIRERIRSKNQKTDFAEAVMSVYSKLIKSLLNNEPYF